MNNRKHRLQLGLNEAHRVVLTNTFLKLVQIGAVLVRAFDAGDDGTQTALPAHVDTVILEMQMFSVAAACVVAKMADVLTLLWSGSGRS